MGFGVGFGGFFQSGVWFCDFAFLGGAGEGWAWLVCVFVLFGFFLVVFFFCLFLVFF